MSKIILSIIIPVYKVEQYVNRCLESIVSQDLSSCEVILIDDGSPDNCGKICDEYAARYTNIFSYHKENGGLSDARNYGIEKCSGEYIWFIDSDDYITENSISLITSALVSNSCDVLVCQSKTVDDNGVTRDEREYNIKAGMYTSKMYMEQLKSHPESALFCAQFHICRKAFIDAFKLRFLKDILHEDELWTPQLLLNAEIINYSGYNVYYHYMRAGSIMHSSNMEKSGKSDIVIAEKLLVIYDNSRRKDLQYLRDHLTDTYLQAAWKVPEFNSLNPWRKIEPLKNTYYMKTRLKALLFFLSPRIYLLMHKSIR